MAIISINVWKLQFYILETNQFKVLRVDLNNIVYSDFMTVKTRDGQISSIDPTDHAMDPDQDPWKLVTGFK